jgi:hypothetical protein
VYRSWPFGVVARPSNGRECRRLGLEELAHAKIVVSMPRSGGADESVRGGPPHSKECGICVQLQVGFDFG